MSGDHGLDAGFPQRGAVLVEVVAPVGVRPPGPATRAPPYASYRRDGVQQGRIWVTSCRLPPVSVTASGVPWRSTIRWCLEPGRARSTGVAPTWSPLSRPGRASRPRRCRPGPRARRGATRRAGQTGPYTGPGPVPQPAPGRRAGAARHLRGDIAPGGAGAQHVHDAGECRPVGNTQSPRTAAAALGSRW